MLSTASILCMSLWIFSISWSELDCCLSKVTLFITAFWIFRVLVRVPNEYFFLVLTLLVGIRGRRLSVGAGESSTLLSLIMEAEIEGLLWELNSIFDVVLLLQLVDDLIIESLVLWRLLTLSFILRSLSSYLYWWWSSYCWVGEDSNTTMEGLVSLFRRAALIS